MIKLIDFILPVSIVLFLAYGSYTVATTLERQHNIIIEQSFRLGCNESTQFRKLEYCANAASEYAAKRKEQ